MRELADITHGEGREWIELAWPHRAIEFEAPKALGGLGERDSTRGVYRLLAYPIGTGVLVMYSQAPGSLTYVPNCKIEGKAHPHLVSRAEAEAPEADGPDWRG